MSDETETDETKLAALAGEINREYWKGEDSRLELAKMLASARALFESASDWEHWATGNLEIRPSYREEMLAVGQATDPAGALQTLRDAAKARAKRYRERVRHGGAATDTFIEVMLPQVLSDCRDEAEVAAKVQYVKRKGRWIACIRRPAEPEPPAAEPQAEPAEEAAR